MYKIISDGSCDLSPELVEKLDIDVVPFYITTDGIHHQKENVEIGIRDFYQYMIDNTKVFPKTSMPSIQDYLDVFTKYVKEGIDIICLCITTKFSGSYNAAMNAKNMLLGDYPNARIEVIDSTIITVAQGLLVQEAVQKKCLGASFDECVEFIQRIKETGKIFFTIDGMDYLVHGGRVGKLSGLAAGALGIKPLILFKEGEIFNVGVARGRKKSKHKIIQTAVDYMKEHNLDLNDYTIAVGYGYDKEECEQFREELIVGLKKEFPLFDNEIDIYQIGATIGVHTGPLPIGLGFIKKS